MCQRIDDNQYYNIHSSRCNQKVSENCTNLQTSGEQFWEKYILGLGPGLQVLPVQFLTNHFNPITVITGTKQADIDLFSFIGIRRSQWMEI